MDRAIFDRERSAIQEELKNAGQDIEIPDPDSSEYLGTFLALQRTHPRLAARLAGAEQADPADLLDPYTPRPSKITAKHRWNSFVDKNFMRRGIDRKLVLDRQRVFRTGLYTVGGIVVAGLIWSVVAPKPATAADVAAASAASEQSPPGETQAPGGALSTSSDTSGAFTVGSGDSAGTDGSPQAKAVDGTPAPESGESPFASSPSDNPPQPVTTTAGPASESTPPPPAVFNQVSPNDPYAPVTTAPEPPPPVAAASPYADDAPAPIDATPTARSAPFGGSIPEPESVPAPEPMQAPDAPTEVDSPFASILAPQDVSAPPVPENTTAPAAPAPAVVAAPFGGETATPTSLPAAQAATEEQPARGAAMLYQAQRQEQPLPKSALMYQRPAEQSASPRTAIIYAAQGRQEMQGVRPRSAMSAQAQGQQDGSGVSSAGGGSSLTYQRASTTGNGVGSSRGTGGSLIYQGQPKPPAVPGDGAQQTDAGANTPAAFAQTPDPDAPRFTPTSVIQGKLFSNIRTAAGLAVPVIVVSEGGNWVGVATYNTPLGRVDMRFTSFVLNKNGKSYPVEASAYQQGQNGTVSEGVGASIHPIAPTLAVDLARAGINSLNTFTQALQNSGTTSVNGSIISTTRQAPELVQVVRGEIGKVFALPEGNVSIRIVADVAAGTTVQVVYGVGGVPTDQQGGTLP